MMGWLICSSFGLNLVGCSSVDEHTDGWVNAGGPMDVVFLFHTTVSNNFLENDVHSVCNARCVVCCRILINTFGFQKMGLKYTSH